MSSVMCSPHKPLALVQAPPFLSPPLPRAQIRRLFFLRSRHTRTAFPLSSTGDGRIPLASASASASDWDDSPAPGARARSHAQGLNVTASGAAHGERDPRRATSSISIAPSSSSFSSSSSSSPSSFPCILSISGSDSGSGAGVQADLKAAAGRGVWCCTVVSALTAQNSMGVQASLPTPADFVLRQMHSILQDYETHAIKTGMLPNAGVVDAVCSSLQDLAPQVPLVVDPVLVATSGDTLSDDSALDAIRQRLLTLATLVTPNLREAEALLLLPAGSIQDASAMRHAAEQLLALGTRAVLVKGGHLSSDEDALDIFLDGASMEYQELRAPRMQTTNTHGTGCTLSAAIAAELALGKPLLAAVKAAKGYLQEVLGASTGLSLGQGPQGPLLHLPTLRRSLPVEQRGAWEESGATATAPCSAAPAPAPAPAPPIAFHPGQLRVYAVTDARMNSKWGRSVEEAVRECCLGGATIVQIREKDADTGQFIQDVAAALRVTRAMGVPLLVNDRVDVALACDADGVHVGQSDMPARLARRLLGPRKILGVSAKTVEQAVAAAQDGADYVGVGGVYPTSTKAGNRTIGVEGLVSVCRGSPLPVVAIGGINASNAPLVFTKDRPASLSGVACVSALFDQEDVQAATLKVAHLVASCV